MLNRSFTKKALKRIYPNGEVTKFKSSSKVTIDSENYLSYIATVTKNGRPEDITVVPVKQDNRIMLFFNNIVFDQKFDNQINQSISYTIGFKNDEYGWLYKGTFGAFLPKEQFSSLQM